MALIRKATRAVAYELLARAAATENEEDSPKGGSKSSSSSTKSPTSKVEQYSKEANQWINTHVSLVLAACLVGLAGIIVLLIFVWWCLKYKHRKQLLAQEQEELEEGRTELDKMGMPDGGMPQGGEMANGMYPHFGAQQPPEVQVSFADVQHDPSQYYQDGTMNKQGGPGGYTMDAISERTEEHDYNSQGKQTRIDEDEDEEDLNSGSYPGHYAQQMASHQQQQHSSPPQDAYYGDQPGMGIPQPQPHADRDSMYSMQEKTRYV